MKILTHFRPIFHFCNPWKHKKTFGFPKQRSKKQKQLPRCSIKKGVIKYFAKFAGKHLCQSLFFNKVADLRPKTLLKKGFRHRCFSVNFVNCLRTRLLQNASGRLFPKEVGCLREMSYMNNNETSSSYRIIRKLKRTILLTWWKSQQSQIEKFNMLCFFFIK